MTHPDTVTQRYGRLVKRLGFDTHLHSLRHYSATELIAAGVDIRTVAGRLGTLAAARRRCALLRHACRSRPTRRKGARRAPARPRRRPTPQS